ncbi:hypothetical protein NP233_g10858 [Leucocoprinus birnbaumii]|uniref:Tc1-like transposase DDE domain-containing protein n=1 Tax=Leucocoprinus birnbaumii TaxID=56174 RepID=A0AAD5YKY2_9AGAR|nr:hypothetical protein NP233_g10858 [Leucocoprinus birnbaumii]
MVWGCVIDGKKGPLINLDYPGGKGGGMTLVQYQQQVLSGVLEDFYHEVREEQGPCSFQQDNASAHTSKSTNDWFHSHHIPLFPHPSSSPDLNPIEGVWHELKTIIRSSPHPPTMLDTLEAAIQSAWDQLSIDAINKYVGTMEDCVRAIIMARGGHTQY